MSQFQILLLLFAVSSAYGLFESVTLVDNRYEGIVVAINPSVPENPFIINEIRDVFTDASSVLWESTEHRAYFGTVTILVPLTWKGNYNLATNGEVYAKADFVVADPNPMFESVPYTEQYTECGQPGEFIHLTPDFLLKDDYAQNYGPKGKTLIHEWAHLRWGVYDEYATEGYEPFYYSTQIYDQGYIEATRCPLSLAGHTVYPNPQNGNKLEACRVNISNNYMPNEGCVFIPNGPYGQPDDLDASLMSHQFMDQVIHFCHDDPTDPTNMHNKEAPNEHNRLCGQKSVWEIIMSSPDFKNANPPNPSISDVTPSFSIVRKPTNRYVLVLDGSGSMAGDRYEKMMQAATDFIMNYVTFNSYVGIVEFDSDSYIRSDMMEINTNTDRNYLVSKLPDPPEGGTCIGCGIEKGIAVLETSGENPAGGELIVLTDGEENTEPLVHEVRDEVLNKKVVVHSIFFGPSGNQDLEQLTIDSNGIWYFNNLDNGLGLKETFKQIALTTDGDLYSNSYQIYGSTHSMGSNEIDYGSFMIDSSVSKDSVFSFSWSSSGIAPTFTVTSPSGKSYCTNTGSSCYNPSVVSVDYTLRTAAFRFSTTEEGQWSYHIQTSSSSQVVSVMITSMASSVGTPPIVAEAGLSATDVSTGGQAIVVYAKVMQGYQAIIGAVVDAKIASTGGTVTTLRLVDTGSAPDVRENDGIYSRYFTQFSDQGRYSVQVTVHGVGNGTTVRSKKSKVSAAAYNPGYVKPDGTIEQNPNGLTDPNIHGNQGTDATEIEAFSRVVSPGGFSYSGPPSPSVDNFPPSSVIDLKASQLNAFDPKKGVVLTFTAPGNDYDSGTASSYEIRYLYTNPSQLKTNFESGIEVTATAVVQGDLSNPEAANVVERFVINIKDIPQKDLVTVGFAMRATDSAGNTASVSNVAMMNLFLRPPPESCLDKYGKPISGDPFEKPYDCLHFYQCSNGKLNTMPCEPGTVFNPNISVCDYPHNVPQCSYIEFTSTTTAPGVPPTPPAPPVTTAPPPVTTPPPPATTTPPPVTTPPPPATTTDGNLPPVPNSDTCKNSKGEAIDSLFADSTDCTHYYQCSNGILYTMPCPAGLVFNSAQLYCDWPANVPGC